MTDESDTCLIITVLVTRWMLVRRNRKREEAQNNVPPANELAFEDLTDLAVGFLSLL